MALLENVSFVGPFSRRDVNDKNFGFGSDPAVAEVARNLRVASDEPQIADQVPLGTAIVGMCQEQKVEYGAAAQLS